MKKYNNLLLVFTNHDSRRQIGATGQQTALIEVCMDQGSQLYPNSRFYSYKYVQPFLMSAPVLG